MDKLKELLVTYWPIFMVSVGWPVLSGLLNWYLWWDTPEHWEEFQRNNPKYAFLVRLSRAGGPHLRKVVAMWRDYATVKAGGTPLAPVPPTPPSSATRPPSTLPTPPANPSED